ncbi:TPA: hypothetical protein LTW54_003259 [Enterobacter hormaechei]|nr:hypothetical protein [Enterobacter hormaechei]
MTTKAAQKISLWEFFQQLGKTFMLPVALLSFCGIMLGIGSSLTDVCASVSSILCAGPSLTDTEGGSQAA